MWRRVSAPERKPNHSKCGMGKLPTCASRVAAINPKLAMGNTIYLTAVDKDRNCCSLIQSNFGGFGSYVVPGDAADKALPHHYTTEQEIRDEIMVGFRILSLTAVPSEATAHGADPRPGVKYHVLAVREDESK